MWINRLVTENENCLPSGLLDLLLGLVFHANLPRQSTLKLSFLSFCISLSIMNSFESIWEVKNSCHFCQALIRTINLHHVIINSISSSLTLNQAQRFVIEKYSVVSSKAVIFHRVIKNIYAPRCIILSQIISQHLIKFTTRALFFNILRKFIMRSPAASDLLASFSRGSWLYVCGCK